MSKLEIKLVDFNFKLLKQKRRNIAISLEKRRNKIVSNGKFVFENY